MIQAIHPIPAFTDNYIWVMTDASGENACVVDPGDAAPVLDYLASNKLNLTDILITHHHPDHTGGLKRLIERYAPRVVGPKPSRIPGITDYAGEGDTVTLFGTILSVMEVPGHTLDHIAFYGTGEDARGPILFCGDTLFAAGCGRLFEGTPEVMHASLSKFMALPGNTAVYCTHEYTLANLRFALAADPENDTLKNRVQSEQEKRERKLPTLPSSIELELQTNPFLRCSKPALRASAEQQLQHAVTDEVEVFAALRRWKDNF